VVQIHARPPRGIPAHCRLKCIRSAFIIDPPDALRARWAPRTRPRPRAAVSRTTQTNLDGGSGGVRPLSTRPNHFIAPVGTARKIRATKVYPVKLIH
jgi:hypothetical protein